MKKTLLQFVTAVTLLCLPIISFAQAPTLGTAANFVLFTTTGAVTNTGISQFTGNVGSNSGSSTGFGNVNGVMHSGDGTTSTASADLLTAYNQLNSAIPTSFPDSVFGNGDTLTAGVYQITGVTTLGGNLYLNGQGNANAVFIIQIQAAFSSSAAAKVKLINSAQACNVFWKVEGMVSLATGTFMRGTIIANNAAIDMSPNDTLEGRALSTTGAITTNGVIAYTPSGCGSAVLTGPACPNLASTAGYAIFSGNGSVTNATPSTTYVTGDVGTNVGLTTGFDTLNVNGTVHPIPDVSTAACAADLINVYTYLNTLTHDIELLYPAQFGNDLVLTPHTYLLNAGTSFIGSVYLNGEGNPNAVFVIKINGALTTGTFSKVRLMNGTQAKNVFWKVDGAVTINDYSVFNGTIVCNNGALNLNTGDTLYGRAFTTNGALSTSALYANLPPGITGSCSPLSVNWLYFNGKAVKENVLLEWATANEKNNSYFTIEKSKDGKTFETLTTVNAATQKDNQTNKYSFTDKIPYNSGYYRISQTDKSGQREYYRTIQVSVNLNTAIQVNHYVEANNIFIQASAATPREASIQLYSIEGKKMISKNIMLSNTVNTFKMEAPFHSGMYLLFIESKGAKLYTGKVLIP